jgi:predicted HAD superfamily hydrolase
MLQKCGYTSYLELYLSSDINKRKSTGRMFKYVLSKLGINKRSILHIGDNLLSDNIIPRIHGINTYLVKKNKNNNFFNKKVSIEYRSHYNELQNFISNHLDDRKDYFWNMGYETFGPILYGFSFWLKQSIKNDKIFFLSRDGYLMQRAFNLISGNIDSMYLYASRRALIVPTFWMDDTIKEMIDKLYIRDTIKIKNLFRKFGLEDAEFKDAVLSCGYSMNEEIKYADLLACEKFKGLFNKLKPAIHKNSKKEYEVLLKYMKDVNFNGDVSIIDIGWNGNMQLAFSNIVKSSGEKTNITGYYIGVLPESKNLGKINMKAFLFDESNNTDIYLTLKAINSIFESLFLAPHGSVKKMSMKNGKFTPVLLDYEYKDGKEKTAYKNIQDGALKFIEDFNNSYIRNVLNIDARLSFYSMAKFAYNPRNVDVEEFGDFCFLEDDIVFLAKPKSLIFYLFHPKKLLQELYLSGWVIGFMKRLTKINIFYSYLYKKMIRMYLNSRKNN